MQTSEGSIQENKMIIQPIPVLPIIPINPFFRVMCNTAPDVLVNVLVAVVFIGIAVFLGWKFTQVLLKRNYKSNLVVNLVLSGVVALALFLRFGMSVAILQGLYLYFILLFASWSDITSHEVPDWVWLCLLPIAIMSIPTVSVASMVAAVFVVLIPQLAVSILPSHKPLGGADTKLTVCMAMVLGFSRGIGAYLVGLLAAVIFMSIYNKVKNRSSREAFALIPFLAGAAFTAFLI